MKHKKVVKVPEHAKTIIEKTTCDICKLNIKTSQFVTDEVEITYRKGSSYPECSYGEKTTFDICGSCFTSKVIPALESLGANPEIEEYDY